MPLPVTISGISVAVAPVGPFQCNLAKFVIEAGTSNQIIVGDADIGSKQSQSFTVPANSIAISTVTFWVNKVGTPVDNVLVDIFLTDGAGTPTGSSLGTSSGIAGSTLTGVFKQCAFSFVIPVAVTSGIQYAAVVSRSAAFNASNYYSLGYGATDVNAAEQSATGRGIPVWILDSRDITMYVDLTSTVSNYYFIGRDGTTATTLQAFKATAPSTAWASIATKTGFTTAILNIAGCQVGSVIHLLVQDGTMSSSVATKYLSYDMGTDTFLATMETVSAAQILTGQIAAGYGASLVVRSNGEVVAFYNGLQTKTTTLRARVYYRRRTGLNTYGTETMVDAALQVDNRAPIVVLGATDRVHLLWFDGTNTLQRHLTSANVLGTAASTGATAATLDACTFNDAGTIRHVGFTPAQTIRWASADNPTVTAAAVAFGTPTRTADDGTDVYALYQNSADSDLYIKKSTDRGATFAAGTDVFTATVAAVDANLSKNQLAYQRGSDVVFPYIVNDNGTLKYNESIVRTTAVAAKALPLFSTPRKFAVRHF